MTRQIYYILSIEQPNRKTIVRTIFTPYHKHCINASVFYVLVHVLPHLKRTAARGSLVPPSSQFHAGHHPSTIACTRGSDLPYNAKCNSFHHPQYRNQVYMERKIYYMRTYIL